jgi:hypothetical protein
LDEEKNMLGTTLTILIPAVVIAYGVWLAVRLIRNRKKGGCCGGGCAGCPYAGGCRSTESCRLNEDMKKKRDAGE